MFTVVVCLICRLVGYLARVAVERVRGRRAFVVPASDTKAHRDYIQKISRKFPSGEVTVDGGVNMSYKPIAPAPTGSNHTPPGEFRYVLGSFNSFYAFIFSPFEVFFVHHLFKRTVLILEKGVSEPTVKEVRDTDKGGGVKGAICLAHYINVVHCSANSTLSRLRLKANRFLTHL